MAEHPTPPSELEDLLAQVHEYGCSCNRLGHEMECKTIRAKVARALSERDEFIRVMLSGTKEGELLAQLREREREIAHEWNQRLTKGLSSSLDPDQMIAMHDRMMNAERERELRDTTTALAAAHHELERTDQVRADLAEREQEVTQQIAHAVQEEILRCPNHSSK